MKLTKRAYAKVNLSLDVIGTREDGYHLLRSVMQQIDLFDEITAEPSDKIEIRCNRADVPTDSHNIMWKVAEKFFAYTGINDKGVCFTLVKNIPSGAGLGGGSADGVTALRLLNEMYQTGLSNEQMTQIVAPIGADLPFFVYGKTALVEGIGEKVTPFSAFLKTTLLLVKPPFGMSTPQIYHALDDLTEFDHPNTDKVITAIKKGNLSGMAANMKNSLETVGSKLYPEIAEIRAQLLALGAEGAMMSGSGSTVFGLYSSEIAASKAATMLADKGYECFVTKPV